MARFVDLEEDGDDGASHPPEDLNKHALQAMAQMQSKDSELATTPSALSLGCSSSIARAFQCYPYVCLLLFASGEQLVSIVSVSQVAMTNTLNFALESSPRSCRPSI